jgi:hypothetical protein
MPAAASTIAADKPLGPEPMTVAVGLFIRSIRNLSVGMETYGQTPHLCLARHALYRSHRIDRSISGEKHGGRIAETSPAETIWS